MYVRINAEHNQKLVKVKEAMIGNLLVFPQIQYLNLDPRNFVNNLYLEEQNNKISWKLEFETSLLDENQILSPNNQDFLLTKKKTTIIEGSLDLNQKIINS